MTTKQVAISLIIYTAVCVASGYYLAPQKIKTETKIVKVEVEKTSTDQKQNKNTDTTMTVRKNKDGSSETVIHKITNQNTATQQNTSQVDSSQTTATKEVEKSKGSTTILGMVGVDVNRFQSGFIYGASVNRTILGPIGIGIWGLTNGTCGVNLGLSF